MQKSLFFFWQSIVSCFKRAVRTEFRLCILSLSGDEDLHVFITSLSGHDDLHLGICLDLSLSIPKLSLRYCAQGTHGWEGETLNRPRIHCRLHSPDVHSWPVIPKPAIDILQHSSGPFCTNPLLQFQTHSSALPDPENEGQCVFAGRNNESLLQSNVIEQFGPHSFPGVNVCGQGIQLYPVESHKKPILHAMPQGAIVLLRYEFWTAIGQQNAWFFTSCTEKPALQDHAVLLHQPI